MEKMFEKAWEMCTKAVEKYPSNFVYVPEMCKKTVEKEPYSLKYVPDYFVTREWVDMSRDHYYDDDGNHGWYDWYENFFERYEGFQKRKAKKAKIKEVVLPIVWHPSRWWDCCVPEDEKRETEKLWE